MLDMNKVDETEFEGTESDGEFTIIVEGQSIRCEKSVLKERSEYFRAMLESSMLESIANTATLHEQEYTTVSALVNFMRTGQLKMGQGDGNMRKLTEAAVMLQIDTAVASLTHSWRETLCDETCLDLMMYAKSLSLEALYSFARRHAMYYFTQVREHPAFQQLDVEELITYLSCPDLNCNSEVDVLDAIMVWYGYEMGERKPLLEKLLVCFHSEDLAEDEWDVAYSHQLLNESKAWSDMLKENKSKTTETVNQKKFRQLPVMFVTIGGYISHTHSDRICTEICRFDHEEKTFKPFLNLNDVYPEVGSKMGYQVTVIDKYIYLSGGQVSMTRYSMILDVWRLDGFDLTWEKVTRLPSPRRHHGACGSQSSLFVIGGFGKYRDILDTVQQYDTIDDKWLNLPKMPEAMFTPHAVYCKQKLFVSKTDLVYLDMKTMEWTTFRKMSLDVMNSIPYFFENFVYEFPYSDQELNWSYEHELGKTKLWRISLDTGVAEEVPYTDAIQFGNRCVLCNGKFYTVNRYSEEFVSGCMKDLSYCEKLGTKGKAGQGCFIVAIPHYPAYKVNANRH